jgi:protein phosphatase
MARKVDMQCELAWVGDSRIYLWRDQRLVQLSRDHSVVQRMLDGGLISPVQAQHHPQRNLITSCLGGMLPHEMEVGLRTFAWQRDDLLLLCSDGLTDELDDEALRLEFERDLQDAARVEALIQQSLTAGGRDNVSVVLVRAPVQAPARAPRLAAEVQAPVVAQPSVVQEEESNDLLKAGLYALLGAGVAIMLVGLLKWLR